MNSKALITGCAGFIGCHLTSYFLNEGASIIGIDNLSRPGAHANLEWLQSISKGGLTFYNNDICDFDGIKTVFKRHSPVDLVIHEAAQVAVTTSVLDPQTDFEINARGTFNLLEATRLYSPNAFFEYASTNKVYGKMEALSVTERNSRYEYEDLKEGASEEINLDFYSPYGCSKGAADQYVRDYSRIYNLRTAVLRQSCIYGTRQFGIEDQGWIAWFVIASILKKPITIYGDGKQIRDILWIDDLIDAYVQLYKNADAAVGNVFNVGGGRSNTLSILELVDFLKNEKILIQEPAYADWRPGDQKVYVSDIRKIEDAIQWRPSTSPREGIGRLIAWASEHQELLQNILG